jgi:hypothetical protein
MGLSCLSHRDLACLQTALRNVIEPIFERDFAPQSYGFRPGRGCKDALRRVDQLLKEGTGLGGRRVNACRRPINLRTEHPPTGEPDALCGLPTYVALDS